MNVIYECHLQMTIFMTNLWQNDKMCMKKLTYVIYVKKCLKKFTAPFEYFRNLPTLVTSAPWCSRIRCGCWGDCAPAVYTFVAYFSRGRNSHNSSTRCRYLITVTVLRPYYFSTYSPNKEYTYISVEKQHHIFRFPIFPVFLRLVYYLVWITVFVWWGRLGKRWAWGTCLMWVGSVRCLSAGQPQYGYATDCKKYLE